MNRRLALSCALALVAACTEEVADDDAGGAPDAEPGDAGRAPDSAFEPGAPCLVDDDCTGACLVDPAASAGGQRCFAPCDAEGACPDGSRCVTGEGGGAGCMLQPPAPLPEGADCGEGGECDVGLVCAVEHPAGPVCARACDVDADCPADTRCAPETVEPRFCAPPGADIFRCPYVPCAVPSFLCVPDDVAVPRCVSLCADEGVSCSEGGLCTRRRADGALYCRPIGDQPLGASCASGGEAACDADLECLAAAQGDPAALCTRRCEAQADCCEDCVEDFTCRRPAGRDERYCVVLPFGRGDETGGPGASCAGHGPTDCRPELDCVPDGDGASVCAAACEAGACAARFLCLDGWCVPEPVVEPPGDRGLGESCAEGGAVVCASGVCVSPGAPGDAVCSRPCDEEACPEGFTCAELDAGRFCLPG